jgi:hypothetical protein
MPSKRPLRGEVISCALLSSDSLSLLEEAANLVFLVLIIRLILHVHMSIQCILGGRLFEGGKPIPMLHAMQTCSSFENSPTSGAPRINWPLHAADTLQG